MSEKDEKTEKATPKKREDARKEGQVMKSRDVVTALETIAMFAMLGIVAGGIGEQMTVLVRQHFTTMIAEPLPLDIPQVTSLFSNAVTELLLMILPLLLTAMIVGLLGNFLQVGRVWSTKPLKPNFKKFNPVKGIKRIFSVRSLLELLKSIVKLVVIFFVVYGDYVNFLDTIPQLMLAQPTQALSLLLEATISMAFKACIGLVATAAADYAYERYSFEKNLKMTKQEIKDEYKNTEGDPKIKGAIRRRQMEMSMSRMMQSVPNADVVITNPTHYAVAVKYDEKVAAAPIVLAKGKDRVAQRIKEKALESGVRCVENKPVAQALYAAVEVGQAIPEDLFKAVAEILAYVYSLREKGRRGGSPRGNPRRPGGQSQGQRPGPGGQGNRPSGPGRSRR